MLNRNQLHRAKSSALSQGLTRIGGSFLTATIATLFFGSIDQVALADPPPPGPIILPDVFCFRFTDITADKDDPEGDKFRFEFEVLNWTNMSADGVRIALNEGTDNGVSFVDAEVDLNGRPIGPDGDGQPNDNLDKANRWSVTESTSTAIQWDVGDNQFAEPISNNDLLGATNNPQACALVPGCQLDAFGNPVIPDLETIDNGDNVLDGFVIEVDGFVEDAILSFNWNLLNESGNPIGTPGTGNNYGFGTVNIVRTEFGDGDAFAQFQPVFAGNTGFSQSQALFFDDTFNLSDWDESKIDTEFAAEFGAGITAAFLNPADNIFNSAVNTQLLDSPPNDNPDPQPVPEPSGIVTMGLFSLSLLGFGKRRRQLG